jgi:hypothetical protein
MDRGADSISLDGSVDGILLTLKFRSELNGKVALFMEDEGAGQGSGKWKEL